MSRLAVGGNNPPSESEILAEKLKGYTKEEALISSLVAKEIPAEIKTDEEAGKLADHIKSLKSARTDIETIFKAEKKPFLDACGVADGWKNAHWVKIDARIKLAGEPIIAWNNKKEAEERERKLELARKAQEEAERLAKEAEAHADVGINDTAEDLMGFAIEAEQKSITYTNSAVGKMTTRSAGSFSTASNRTVWVGAIEDVDQVDLNLLRKYFSRSDIEAAVNRAVREGVRELKGVKIFEENKLTIR